MHRIATIPLKRNFTFLCTKLRKQEASLQMLNTKASFRIKENLAPAWTSSLPFNLTEYSGDLVRLFSTLNMSNRAKTAAKPSKAPFEAEFVPLILPSPLTLNTERRRGRNRTNFN